MLLSARHISRLEAESLPAAADIVIVSISEPDAPPADLQSGFRDVLRLSFWDVTATVTTPERLYESLTDADAQMIYDALERWHGLQEGLHLVVHCRAGMSRSAAAARFAAEHYGLALPHAPDYVGCNIEVLSRLRRVAGDGYYGGE